MHTQNLSDRDSAKQGLERNLRLLPGEYVIYQPVLDRAIFILPVMVLGFSWQQFLFHWDSDGWKIPFFIGGVWIVLTLVRYFTTVYLVTNQRLITKVGLIRVCLSEMLLSRVESIEISQGILARLFRYGTLTVRGTGGGEEYFYTVDNPWGLRDFVQEHASKS